MHIMHPHLSTLIFLKTYLNQWNYNFLLFDLNILKLKCMVFSYQFMIWPRIYLLDFLGLRFLIDKSRIFLFMLNEDLCILAPIRFSRLTSFHPVVECLCNSRLFRLFAMFCILNIFCWTLCEFEGITISLSLMIIQ